MIAMSVIRGTLVITLRPGASNAAAISFNAEFFAPTTCTVAGQPGTTVHPDDVDIGDRRVTGVAGPTPQASRPASGRAGIVRSGIRRLCVMAVHLTRIYTKAGDAGMTRLSNNEQVPKTDPRIAAYADVDECNAAIGVALALASSTTSAGCWGRCRTTCSTWAPTSPPRSSRNPSTRRCGYRGVRRAAGGLVRRVQRAPGQARLLHPPRRHRGRGAAARRRGRSPGAPNGRRGRSSATIPSAPARSRQSISTACPICSLSCQERQIRPEMCYGCRAEAADVRCAAPRGGVGSRSDRRHA